MSPLLIDEPEIIRDGLMDLAARMRRENGCDGDDTPGCMVCDWASELERWTKKLPGLKVSIQSAGEEPTR
jgi:hypothetical protein